MNNIHDKLTQIYANNIIYQTPDNKQETDVTLTESTGNYLKSDDPHCPSTNTGPLIHMVCPNGQIMQSSKPCLLDFPYLPDEAFEGHSLPSLIHSSLVSIFILCNDRCTYVFKSHQFTTKHNNNIFIQVIIDRRNVSCKIPITAHPSASPTPPQEEHSNSAYQTS